MENKPMKWADMIKAWADGIPVEYRETVPSSYKWTEWQDVQDNHVWCNEGVEYRIKPRIAKIGDNTVHVGERVAPSKDTRYYVPSVCSSVLYKQLTWDDTTEDRRYLNNGIVFLDVRGAVAVSTSVILALIGKEK